MSETKHTPGEWSFVPERLYQGQHVGGRGMEIAASSRSIAKICGRDRESEANARFIVRAVNSHEQLLEACKLGREAAAACFRVIATVPELDATLEAELMLAGVPLGFGKRIQDAIKATENGE